MPDFPTVALEETRPSHIMTTEALEALGLPAAARPAAAAADRQSAQILALQTPDRFHRKAWPDYARCLEGAPESDGGKQRSIADFTFCCIAIDHFRRTPEETAEKLLEISSKAKENGHDYALGQALRAADKVAANPRSRSR
jgi:hypothetical protein